MVPYFFALIFCLFDSIYSTQIKKKISNFIIPFENEDSNLPNKFDIKNDINYLIDSNQDLVKQAIIERLEILSNSTLSKACEIIKNNSNYFILAGKIIFMRNNKIHLSYILEDFFNESNTFINETAHILINSTNDVSKNLIKLINGSSGYFWEYIKNIFKVKEIHDLYNHLFSCYNSSLVDIIEIIIKELDKKNLVIFFYWKDFIDDNKEHIYDLVYCIFEFWRERVGITESIRDFIISKTQGDIKLFDELKDIFNNKTIINETFNAIFKFNKKENSPESHITRELVLNTRLVNFTFAMIKNETFVSILSDIIINIYDTANATIYIKYFSNYFIVDNQTNLDIFLDVTSTVGRNLVKIDGLSYFLTYSITKGINEFIFQLAQNFTKISDDCKNLLLSTFINSSVVDEIGHIKSNTFFIKKLMFDSSLNKNDFLHYENCLHNNITFVNKTQNLTDIRPIFIIGIIQDSLNSTMFRNSMLYEKYNYLQSLCVPQGKNTTTNEEICSQNDYNNVLRLFSEFAFNLSNSSIETIIFDNEEIIIKRKDYALLILILIILALPLLIKFFLFLFPLIYKCIFAKNNGKSEIINKLTLEDEKDKKKHDNNQEESEIIKDENNNNNQIENRKWYQLLNKYFDIVNNLKELFNFSFPNTEYNNYNEITYIKGILGISLILNIGGQTFFILMNILHKTIKINRFYFTINFPLYIFFFIALRYSPRLIFSCSGYTLSHKFLSFIEHNPDFCFLKFLSYQSYKYILLISVSFFMRYALYYINFIFHPKKNPVFEIFQSRLEKYNKNYFANLLSFLFYNLSQDEMENNESAIQFLYLPINEVFLFIFGITLISLGIKFKLRID